MASSSSWSSWLMATGVVAVTLPFLAKDLLRRRRIARATEAGAKRIDLLPSECSPIIRQSPPTTTVTFFLGDWRKAEAKLASKVAEIVRANPWLESTLEEANCWGKGLVAFYPAGAVGSKPCFSVRSDLTVKRIVSGTSKMRDYNALVDSVKDVVCKTTDESVGRALPLWRVTLLPRVAGDPSGRCFALVVSANHSLMDGHGFYRLHNMLSEGTPVEALNPQRNFQVPERMLALQGGEPSLFAQCPPGFLLRFLWGTVRNAVLKETEAMGFHPSPDFIARAKARAEGSKHGFVSTNDVLVSSFCSALRCDLAMMAMNFRGRAEGCGEHDVGNYEDLISYAPADYRSPEQIRESVHSAPFTRAGGGKLPTNAGHLQATYGAVTNWATFAKTVDLGAGGKQDLHLPLFDWNKSTPASVVGAMVIFRPNEGKLGVLCAGSRAAMRRVMQCGDGTGTLCGEPILTS